MKKIVLFLCLILLLSGCEKKKKNIEMVVEYSDNAKIAINYPIIHIKKVDEIISNYIDRTYNSFKKDYEDKTENIAELNIDYTYEIINNYINISLITFISTNSLAHPINEIYTIVYDQKNNKILKMNDIINQDKFKELIPKIKQELIQKYKDCILIDLLESKINEDFINYNLFLFTKDGLKIYFNPYEISSGNCNIIDISLPFDIQYEETKPTIIIPNVIDFDPTKKAIALTFDDGPSKYTKKIIELLNKYDAIGTFFVIGNKVEIYKDTISLMYKYGNEIGNHSYNHKWLTRLTDEEFFEQIDSTQEAIKKVTNHTPTLLRPTYGSINNRIRKNSNLDIVMWDVDTRDWKTKNYKTIAYRALNNLEDGDIILMHDIYERTYKALELMLPKLKDEYQFVTVSQLKEIKELKNSQK